MSLGEICNREVVFIERNAPLREAARLMRQYHVGDLVVVEERGSRRMPVGILTDRDIVIEVVARDVAPEEVSAGDVMSCDLVTAGEEDDLLDTFKTMRARGVRRLPVVDGEGALVGIVTIDDFIDIVAEQLTDLVHLVANEQDRERQTRP